MALIWQDVEMVRQAIYGIDTREPIADALEHNTEYKAEVTDTFPRIQALERKHQTRIIDLSLTQSQEIDWIEIVEHVIHDPPTLYQISTSNNTVSATLIDDDDYFLTDTSAAAILISDEDYIANLGNVWIETALDDPTHIEYEEVIHYKQYYALAFIRANET